MGLRVALAIFTVTVFLTSACAVTEKVLHSFQNDAKDGTTPYASLIFDAAGNLYGTTYYGGAYGAGAVFEVTPKAGGGWTEQVLHNFNHNGTDGIGPYAGLIFDAAGNLYGTASGGGAYNYGAVFELTPARGGGWTETVLFSFNSRDGALPYAGLIFDGSGNLYGTTKMGGAHSVGTVFELAPKAGGGWTETVLFSFNSRDGALPYAGLIFDGSGNLYGTTNMGGAHGVGTVFEVTPKAGGGWTEKVLHSFNHNGTDGIGPYAGLIFDAAGNLYGTTYDGGAYGTHGTVFELTPTAGGGWNEKRLHNFGKGTDGSSPYAGLIFHASGNLFGTTAYGGAHTVGTVFELTPTAGGGWTETVVHDFNDDGKDGRWTYASLIFDASGSLYGATSGGGRGACGAGCGTVFEITP